MAIFAENAEEGIVVQGEKILELVAQGQKPKNQIDEVYDCLLYTSPSPRDA